jgi:hypothetical protein
MEIDLRLAARLNTWLYELRRDRRVFTHPQQAACCLAYEVLDCRCNGEQAGDLRDPCEHVVRAQNILRETTNILTERVLRLLEGSRPLRDNETTVIALAEDGLSASAIARKFKCSPVAASGFLRRRGFVIRILPSTVCRKCKQTFSRNAEFFPRDRSQKDGLAVYCRTCKREMNRRGPLLDPAERKRRQRPRL